MSRFTHEMERRALATVALYPRKRSAVVPLLHLGQEQNGYLTEEVMVHIAELTDITPAQVRSVASFYDMFHFEPVGKYVLGICTNIACMLDGAEDLLHHAEKHLGIRSGQTTADGLFTIEEMECVARCNNAPCLQVNYRNFDRTSPDQFDRIVEDLAAGRLDEDVPSHGTLIRVRRSVGLKADPIQVAEERKVGIALVEERRAAALKAEADKKAKGSPDPNKAKAE